MDYSPSRTKLTTSHRRGQDSHTKYYWLDNPFFYSFLFIHNSQKQQIINNYGMNNHFLSILLSHLLKPFKQLCPLISKTLSLTTRTKPFLKIPSFLIFSCYYCSRDGLRSIFPLFWVFFCVFCVFVWVCFVFFVVFCVFFVFYYFVWIPLEGVFGPLVDLIQMTIFSVYLYPPAEFN